MTDSRDGLNPLGRLPALVRDGFSVQHNSDAVGKIVDRPARGDFKRHLLVWKTPQLGYVQMFLNPQNMVISDSKQINSVRTKAGFVIQYAGENLTTISIEGMTGSAGIEGINILRSIYRSEQIAFAGIAEEMERNVVNSGMYELLKGQAAQTVTGGLAGTFADFSAPLLNAFTQPFPTLASLASNVELYFQGELFRGFFKEFSMTESADSPGIFNYSMVFEAYARQGVRRNFMPWHKQPLSPIGLHSDGRDQLTFIGPTVEDEFALATERLQERTQETGNLNGQPDGNRNKSVQFASGRLGESLAARNFEDDV